MNRVRATTPLARPLARLLARPLACLLACLLVTVAAPGLAQSGGGQGIADVRPLEPVPGAAVHVDFAQPLGDADPEVRLAGQVVAVERLAPDRIAIVIPPDTSEGIHSLDIAADGAPLHLLLRVKDVPVRKVWRNVLGGLALFLLGLRSLAQGLRSSVGQRDRKLLVGATRGPVRALGFGAVLGAMTQSTTSAAAVLIGLGQARMVAADAGLWVLMGAYLGTVVTAAILPFAATREALLVVAFGTVIMLAARRRRLRGFGVIVVAFGLLALGLRYIQAGFQPLLGDRDLMAVLATLGGSGVAGVVLSAGLGALLAALLQGPGPVFVLVLGLAQSSGALDLPTALTVLSGAALGSASGVAVLSLPYGAGLRGLRTGMLAFGVCALALQLLSRPLWPWLADLLVAGAPGAMQPGKKVLLPNIGEHLGVGFVLSQLAGLLAFGLLLQLHRRRRAAGGPDRGAEPGLPQLEQRAAVALLPGATLAAVVESSKRAVGSVVGAALTHDAAHAGEAEVALSEARVALDELARTLLPLPGAAGAPTALTASATDTDPGQGQVWLGLGQLQHACESLLRDVESAMADDRRLPERVEGVARQMAELLQGRLEELARCLREGRAPDMHGAQAAEIRLNAMEADARARLLSRVGDGARDEVSAALGQLTAGLEQIGNHVFRVTSTLAQQSQAELL